MPVGNRRSKVALGLSLVCVGALAYGGGRYAAEPRLAAAPQAPAPAPAPNPSTSEYANRSVALLYGNVPLTREQFGEYLIARLGTDRLELFINKSIVEHECKVKGITVTAAEIEASFQDDLRDLQVNKPEFVKNVLGHYRKTLYEWKEDVIRTRLLMTKLVRDGVQVTDEDIQKAFEYHYGEKVEVRILLIPKGLDPRAEAHARDLWAKVRGDKEEFLRAATAQPTPTLASAAGLVKPISRHGAGDKIEEAAFRLQPGEISELIQVPEGYVILRCEKRLPADATKVLAQEKETLAKEVREKKIQARIPEAFKEMRAKADPKKFLGSAPEAVEDLLK